MTAVHLYLTSPKVVEEEQEEGEVEEEEEEGLVGALLEDLEGCSRMGYQSYAPPEMTPVALDPPAFLLEPVVLVHGHLQEVLAPPLVCLGLVMVHLTLHGLE